MASISSQIVVAKQVIAGLDSNGVSHAISVTGENSDTLKTVPTDGIDNLIQEGKKTNFHLSIITEVDSDDI